MFTTNESHIIKMFLLLLLFVPLFYASIVQDIIFPLRIVIWFVVGVGLFSAAMEGLKIKEEIKEIKEILKKN